MDRYDEQLAEFEDKTLEEVHKITIEECYKFTRKHREERYN